MNQPEKIEKEGGRVYLLTVTAEDGAPLLMASVKAEDGRWTVEDAVIDQDGTGRLTEGGMVAFRVTAMVEMMVAKAMGLKVIDPAEELTQAKKENGALKAQLYLALEELKELKGGSI